LIDAIIKGTGSGEWNFGPNDNEINTVADVAEIAGSIWGMETKWEQDERLHPHEANLLLLNSEKARTKLGWKDKLDFNESVTWTTNWYLNVLQGGNPLEETLRNIHEFESR
jgi:CDP-glucose 4,6-dehydratase